MRPASHAEFPSQQQRDQHQELPSALLSRSGRFQDLAETKPQLSLMKASTAHHGSSLMNYQSMPFPEPMEAPASGIFQPHSSSHHLQSTGAAPLHSSFSQQQQQQIHQSQRIHGHQQQQDHQSLQRSQPPRTPQQFQGHQQQQTRLLPPQQTSQQMQQPQQHSHSHHSQGHLQPPHQSQQQTQHSSQQQQSRNFNQQVHAQPKFEHPGPPVHRQHGLQLPSQPQGHDLLARQHGAQQHAPSQQHKLEQRPEEQQQQSLRHFPVNHGAQATAQHHDNHGQARGNSQAHGSSLQQHLSGNAHRGSLRRLGGIPSFSHSLPNPIAPDMGETDRNDNPLLNEVLFDRIGGTDDNGVSGVIPNTLPGGMSNSIQQQEADQGNTLAGVDAITAVGQGAGGLHSGSGVGNLLLPHASQSSHLLQGISSMGPQPGMGASGIVSGPSAMLGTQALGNVPNAVGGQTGLGGPGGFVDGQDGGRYAQQRRPRTRTRLYQLTEKEKKERHNAHTRSSRLRIDRGLDRLKNTLKKVKPHLKLNKKADIVDEADKLIREFRNLPPDSDQEREQPESSHSG